LKQLPKITPELIQESLSQLMNKDLDGYLELLKKWLNEKHPLVYGEANTDNSTRAILYRLDKHELIKLYLDLQPFL
jgi:hypothetical protein